MTLDLPAVLEQFRTSYVLYFTPQGVDPQGAHTLEVRVKRPNVEVGSRRSYAGDRLRRSALTETAAPSYERFRRATNITICTGNQIQNSSPTPTIAFATSRIGCGRRTRRLSAVPPGSTHQLGHIVNSIAEA